MTKTYFWAGIGIVILVGAFFFYQSSHKEKETALSGDASDFGTYHYECDEHVTFSMTPASDMSSIRIKADSGTYPPEATLLKKEATTTAVRYEGSGVIFTATGETVTLGEGDSALNCSPVPSQDEAPFNFGDAGAGAMDDGGAKQDARLAVNGNIVGKWQSTEDPKFMREFKADGTATDFYDGKAEASGTWKAYTKENPATVSFPLEAGAVYIQMKMAGLQGDTLDFKLVKLTPENLSLIYMERGGALDFTAVR